MIPLGKLMLRACMEVGRHFPFKFAWGLYIKGCNSRGCHRKSPRRPLPGGSPFGCTSIRPEVILNAETFRVGLIYDGRYLAKRTALLA